MKVKIFIICCMCAFISCDNSNEVTHTVDKVELTQEEYASIAYDDPKEITDSEVLELVNNFSNTHTRSRGTLTRIKNKFYVTVDRENKIQRANTRSVTGYSIPIYEIELKDDNVIGYSLVSADERCPAVLAYIPIISKSESSQSIGVELMTEIAEKTLLSSITKIEDIKDSLREKTLIKLTKALNKKAETITFSQIKDLIKIKQKVTTKSKKEDFPSSGTFQSEVLPLIKVTWDQVVPYNRKLKQACYYDIYDGYEGRYAAGCAVVCIAHILSYFEPPMFADGVTINWKLLKSSPQVKTTDSSERINQISTLMKFIGNRTNTEYSCSIGGSTNTKTAVEKFLPLYNIVADSRSSWNTNKVKSSLGTNSTNSRPIIITGTCDRGNHAWVLDGFQKRTNNFTQELYYVHANMGWSGNGDGYFLIGNSMSFQTGGDDYNRNIAIYPNVRKK